MQQDAEDLCAGIRRRLRSLEEHSIPQLKNCRGPMDMHNDLVQEARQDVHVVEATLEELALRAEDQPTSRMREDMLERHALLARQTSRLKLQIREATLSSQRSIQSTNALTQREALLSTSSSSKASLAHPNTSSTGGGSKDDELMSATAGVTDGLRRTRQLLEQELERSSLSTQMLERSSQTLTLTTHQYSSFSGLLQTSKNLINMMQKADMLDRLLILAALAFFALVCILIIKRRILDRGIRASTLLSRVVGKAIIPGHHRGSSSSPSLAQTASAALSSLTTSHTILQKESVRTLGSIAATVSAVIASSSNSMLASSTSQLGFSSTATSLTTMTAADFSAGSSSSSLSTPTPPSAPHTSSFFTDTTDFSLLEASETTAQASVSELDVEATSLPSTGYEVDATSLTSTGYEVDATTISSVSTEGEDTELSEQSGTRIYDEPSGKPETDSPMFLDDIEETTADEPRVREVIRDEL